MQIIIKICCYIYIYWAFFFTFCLIFPLGSEHKANRLTKQGNTVNAYISDQQYLHLSALHPPLPGPNSQEIHFTHKKNIRKSSWEC